MRTPSPGNSHAVVIGIEEYKAGPSWNLDGPASDALRMLEYVRGCGVPQANTRAFLAPLAQNGTIRQQAEALAASVSAPTQAALDDLIEQWLPALTSDLLVLFFAGHGVITIDDERRLYTADATADSKRNIDINSLLATLRTDRYPNISRQVVIVDACANYIPNPAASLTHRTYTAGAGVDVDQFALYAASPGEYAKNLNTEKSGLLSRELRAVLPPAAESAWPPDMGAAATTLAERFIDLRQQRQTRQTPATFWFRSPARSGGARNSGVYLGQMSKASAAGPPVARKLALADTRTLLNAFLELDSMRQQKDRDWIVRQLRPEIGTLIQRDSRDRIDTMMIMERSWKYGALLELLQVIDVIEMQSPAFTALVTEAHRLFPDDVPERLDN